jgi:SAM-dependent methyltransferase
MTPSLKHHWNKKYADGPISQLGWYEPRSTPSVQLIEACAVPKHSPIVDAGSGASTLIANLLEIGYQNLIAIDISDVALAQARNHLNEKQAARVQWVVDDVTRPSALLQLHDIAVWHDRAVFHFLNDEQDRQTYRCLVQKALKPGGFLVIATFALGGAAQCSGLPVQKYSAASLCEFFGDGFKLVESFDYLYTMPSGDERAYVYARFQKTPAS